MPPIGHKSTGSNRQLKTYRSWKTWKRDFKAIKICQERAVAEKRQKEKEVKLELSSETRSILNPETDDSEPNPHSVTQSSSYKINLNDVTLDQKIVDSGLKIPLSKTIPGSDLTVHIPGKKLVTSIQIFFKGHKEKLISEGVLVEQYRNNHIKKFKHY